MYLKPLGFRSTDCQNRLARSVAVFGDFLPTQRQMIKVLAEMGFTLFGYHCVMMLIGSANGVVSL